MTSKPFIQVGTVRLDEASGFPYALRTSVHEAVAAVAKGERHPPRHVFLVNLELEALRIPCRLYYDPELLRHGLATSDGVRRAILACLGTRHCDGHLRQECLAELWSVPAAWVIPYVIQLASEYVVEIVRDVDHSIPKIDKIELAAFVRENPDYIDTLQRRVTSYWSCYHRFAYPDRSAYPGMKVITYLRKAFDSPNQDGSGRIG